MNREEFIKKLRKAMSGDFPAREIDVTAEYYEDYIDMQIKKGKSEQEVLKELGDPALIAKSMKAASGGEEKKSYSGGGWDHDERSGRSAGGGKLPGWLVLLIGLLIVFAIVSLILKIVFALLPIVLFLALSVWLYRFFTQKK